MKFYTKQEVADILSVHPRTVEKYLLSGKMKGVKLGTMWRISEEDFMAFYIAVKQETINSISTRYIDNDDTINKETE